MLQRKIKEVMKHHWGCDEGGAPLALVVRRGLLEVTFELSLKEKEPASFFLALLDFQPVPVSRSEWVSVTRL